MITEAQKKALQDAGYTIEVMGQVWGGDFTGQFRWLNNRHNEDDGGDGFGVVQFSEDAAWEDALQYQEQQLGIPVFVPEEDCINGFHSWTSAVGKLDPNERCSSCGEAYGNPD